MTGCFCQLGYECLDCARARSAARASSPGQTPMGEALATEVCEVCGVRPADGAQQVEDGHWVATCDSPVCEAEAAAL